jgi:hypothetical protein
LFPESGVTKYFIYLFYFILFYFNFILFFISSFFSFSLFPFFFSVINNYVKFIFLDHVQPAQPQSDDTHMFDDEILAKYFSNMNNTINSTNNTNNDSNKESIGNSGLQPYHHHQDLAEIGNSIIHIPYYFENNNVCNLNIFEFLSNHLISLIRTKFYYYYLGLLKSFKLLRSSSLYNFFHIIS